MVENRYGRPIPELPADALEQLSQLPPHEQQEEIITRFNPHMLVETRETSPQPELTIDLGRQIINLMGPEGSGKTTIGKRLSAASGKPYLSVGLRDLAANDQGQYGDLIREMFAKSIYLTDRQVLLDIYTYRFKREDLANGFILDGGLRDVTEVRGFPRALKKADRSMPVTNIFLRVPGWMSLERLSKNPHARGRSDDTEDRVLARLSRFYDHLAERASAIEEQPNWRLIHINATGTPKETFEKVKFSLQPTLTESM